MKIELTRGLLERYLRATKDPGLRDLTEMMDDGCSVRGVVLQSKPDPKTGRSTHPVFAEKQRALGIGSVDAPTEIGPLFARSAS